MANVAEKRKRHDPIRYAQMVRCAKIIGVTVRNVRLALDDQIKNDNVVEMMMDIKKMEAMANEILTAKYCHPCTNNTLL